MTPVTDVEDMSNMALDPEQLRELGGGAGTCVLNWSTSDGHPVRVARGKPSSRWRPLPPSSWRACCGPCNYSITRSWHWWATTPFPAMRLRTTTQTWRNRRDG